jgi:hypothetical protein
MSSKKTMVTFSGPGFLARILACEVAVDALRAPTDDFNDVDSHMQAAFTASINFDFASCGFTNQSVVECPLSRLGAK